MSRKPVSYYAGEYCLRDEPFYAWVSDYSCGVNMSSTAQAA